MGVVEAIRSWKSDVCKRKIQIEFAPFVEAYDTAEALFSVRDKVKGDFCVIVGNALFDAAALVQALRLHRTQDAVLTVVAQPASETNTQPVPLNKSLTENLCVTMVGYARDQRLVYMRNRNAVTDSMEGGRIVLKKSVLRRFPEVDLRARLCFWVADAPRHRSRCQHLCSTRRCTCWRGARCSCWTRSGAPSRPFGSIWCRSW